MDTTDTHEKLLVELELSILKRVWPKLHQRYKSSHRNTTFLDVLKHIRGDPACTRTDIPEDLRPVSNDLQSSKGQAEVDMGERMHFWPSSLTGSLLWEF